MWTHERYEKIIQLVNEHGKISTNDLISHFNVSRETIRRDLMELDLQGALQRVHGGAIPASNVSEPQSLANRAPPPVEPNFSTRLANKMDVKLALGHRAVELIPEGSAIFIDAGTTTLAFAKALLSKPKRVRLITNSIDIAQLLSGRPLLDVLLLGGVPDTDTHATYGELALSDIDRFRTDFSIISPVGVHKTDGLTSYHLRESEIAKAMLNHSDYRIVIADSSKIGAQSRVKICPPEYIDHLVVDKAEDVEFNSPKCKLHLVNE